MRRSETQPLKAVIKEYVEALKMKQKLKEVGLISSWEKAVGRSVMLSTKNIYIKDRILHVELKSSVVRNELHMIKEPLINRLNQLVNEHIIDDIILR